MVRERREREVEQSEREGEIEKTEEIECKRRREEEERKKVGRRWKRKMRSGEVRGRWKRGRE